MRLWLWQSYKQFKRTKEVIAKVVKLFQDPITKDCKVDVELARVNQQWSCVSKLRWQKEQ